jgi:hypothetical protein
MDQGHWEFRLGNGLMVALVTGKPTGKVRVVWIDVDGRGGVDELSQAALAGIGASLAELLKRFKAPATVVRHESHTILMAQASVESFRADARLAFAARRAWPE